MKQFMNANEKKDRFQKYHSNVKMIEEGFKAIEKIIKDKFLQLKAPENNGISNQIENEISIFNRILTGIVISWSEVVIKRLLYEPNAFEEEQIKLIHQQNGLEQKWRLALKLAFYKAFRVSPYNNTNPLFSGINIQLSTILTQDKLDKYNSVRDAISIDLVPAIDLRNKVQHGEWVNSFKPARRERLPTIPNLPSFDQDLTDKVNNQNLLTLKNKINQVKALYKLIHDLAAFTHYGNFKLDNASTPFEKFFNQNYNRIISNRRLLLEINLDNYKEDLYQKYLRGLAKKEENKRRQPTT